MKKYEKIEMKVLLFEDEVVRTSGFEGREDFIGGNSSSSGGGVDLPMIP